MHIQLPMKMFRFTRVIIFVIFAFVITTIYFCNKHVIDATLGVSAVDENRSLKEFWEQLGIETRSTKFIRPDPNGIPIDDIAAYRANLLIRRRHPKEDVTVHQVKLNINQSDVIVMLHVQKTGGTTFEDHLINTNSQPPCQCDTMPGHPLRSFSDQPMCSCLNDKGQNWMFNRHNVGWACGVHPDFTELPSCVEAWFNSQVNEDRYRKYHYITMVRDPVSRFVSEWMHIRRGATWKDSRLNCDGRDASLEEVPFCFKHGTWRNVSLQEFMNCSSNMAFNRQTRMLANLSLSDCYRLKSNLTKQQRGEIMLQSAKDNLARVFRFFGMTEYLRETQMLFEKTFSLKFLKDMIPKKGTHSSSFSVFSDYYWNKILEENILDVRLYQYAKDLFLQRLDNAGIQMNRRDREAISVSQDFTYIIMET